MALNKNKILYAALSFILLSFIYFLLYKLYIPRVMEFGCFDDCHTIATGYFISKGKEIYSEIFYNHQLIFPYLSSFIQALTQPQSIYELILRHRQAILLLSFIFNLVFILRFGKIGFLFVILFEFSKFYFFGDRFLPEAIVVYPIVYMTFLVLSKLNGTKPMKLDYSISALYTFFIVFSREPYIPLALLLFLFVLSNKDHLKEKVVSIFAFILFSIAALLTVNIKEFIYIFLTFNPQAVIASEVAQGSGGLGILKLIFYYTYLFFEGANTFLRHYLIGVSVAFLLSIFFYVKQTKNIKLVLVSLLILGAACTRFVVPGQLFFEAYRLNVWYGVLLIIVLFYLLQIKRVNVKAFTALSLIFLLSFIYLSFNKESFLLKKSDPHVSLLTNYGRIHQIGEVLKMLSNKNDTLFADGAEEILYPVSKLSSNYKYSLYASQMPMFAKYTDARTEMFEKDPPDFYYDFCKDAKIPTYRLEEKHRANYIQLLEDGRPSCLFINKDKLKEVSEDKLKKLAEWKFSF